MYLKICSKNDRKTNWFDFIWSGQECNEDNYKNFENLYWLQNSKFGWDMNRDISTFEEVVSDPLPFPVNISNPQTPMAGFGVFNSPKARQDIRDYLKAETCYRGTIYAYSHLKDKPYTTSFDFKLSDKNLEGLDRYEQNVVKHEGKLWQTGIHVTIGSSFEYGGYSPELPLT